MRVHAALVNAFTVCQAECRPLLILVSLGCFFTLIHISDSRRGALKSAACHSWSSCPRSWGVTLLGFTGFHFCFSLHSGLGTHPAYAPVLVRLHPSCCDPQGQEGRLGLRLFPAALSTPIPCPSSDSQCLGVVHQPCRKVGMLWWATFQAAFWAGMQWHSSCAGHHRYWGRAGTTTLEQEGLEQLVRSELVSVLAKTWRRRKQV